jgi:hypothetical protein
MGQSHCIERERYTRVMGNQPSGLSSLRFRTWKFFPWGTKGHYFYLNIFYIMLTNTTGPMLEAPLLKLTLP